METIKRQGTTTKGPGPAATMKSEWSNNSDLLYKCSSRLTSRYHSLFSSTRARGKSEILTILQGRKLVTVMLMDLAQTFCLLSDLLRYKNAFKKSSSIINNSKTGQEVWLSHLAKSYQRIQRHRNVQLRKNRPENKLKNLSSQSQKRTLCWTKSFRHRNRRSCYRWASN